MSTETNTRNIYYRDEDFTLEFEWYNKSILLHCEVRKFTPSVAKQGYAVLASLLDECREAGVKQVMAVLSNHKFAKMYGGKKVNEIEYLGKIYEVIIWETPSPQLPWQQSVLVQPL